jgi:hypothetical protein
VSAKDCNGFRSFNRDGPDKANSSMSYDEDFEASAASESLSEHGIASESQ